MKNIGVNITYKNAKQEPVCRRTYTLDEYTDMMHADQLRLITDVENMVYELNGSKSKEDWSDASWVSFCTIKHKLLDKAGEVKRLPENLVEYDKAIQATNDDLCKLVAEVFDRP